MKLPEMFGCRVFGETELREMLTDDVYAALKKTIQEGNNLDIAVANAVATAMKDWALENGATHYTHWFQPLTGITAEKHDCFISPAPDGKVIMEFSGKELIKGEPDASSFPSGGLRATFEARGYTAWDPTSYAFLKDGTLCIPTAFCSFGGQALDNKTPLLRSMHAINKQAMRILKLFGSSAKSINTTVGAEQEYFLIDKDCYNKRKDLIYTGRTLFGAKPPKGQELNDHYFGSIKPRVAEFMHELDSELWKFGILAKTKHNEAAPAQHELAPIFTSTNIATDHNQLTMETMKKVAAKHNMVCLLHEKPFAGVNGSGKHNNWSISTDDGTNLLEPGDTPYENAQFLLFLCAVVKAVDDYQDLLRISVASAGNDHRLGALEAPPAVVSIFLGDELTSILDAIESDNAYAGRNRELMKVGVDVLPRFPKDNTDRNRTSPFAFTGNKFEFRMVGSNASIADANIVINTSVAESLSQFADELENVADFNAALHTLIQNTVREHKRIIFNGNGYDEKWIKEATEVRGLLNLRTTPDCIPCWLKAKNIELFERHGVFTESEIHSRHEIMFENYCNILSIEALTMLDMARRDIMPAISRYTDGLACAINDKLRAVPNCDCGYETELVRRLSKLLGEMNYDTAALDKAFAHVPLIVDIKERAFYFRDIIISLMDALRAAADEAETLTSEDCWPFPTYGDLLFSVR